MARRRKAVQSKHAIHDGESRAETVRAAFERRLERGVVAEDLRVATIPSAGDRAYAASVVRLLAGRGD